MRSRDPRASDANRGWCAGTASFLDGLHLEVGVLTAGRISKRSLWRQGRLAAVLAHDIALLEWVRSGRDFECIGPVQRLDVMQDVAQLVAIAGDLFRCHLQSCQASYVLHLAVRELRLTYGNAK